MENFVRIAVIFIGFANASVFGVSADKPLDDVFLYFLGDLPSWTLVALYGLSAVFVGLLASEIVVRFVRQGLPGDFWTRYLTMVLAVCLGGVFLGVLLASASVLTDGAIPGMERSVGALFLTPLAGFVGCWLGFVEGLVIGLPLAVVLGRFSVQRDRSRPAMP